MRSLQHRPSGSLKPAWPLAAVLTGAFIFTADLVRAMEPCPRGTNVNFVRASSYHSGTTSSGQVSLKVDLASSAVRGRHVVSDAVQKQAQRLQPCPSPCGLQVLVEDIVDTGNTLTRLKEYMLQQW